MKQIEEFALVSLAILGCMAIGWTICVIGLGALGVL